MKKLFTYENGIVSLMALIFGAMFFDRLALNFLMPYVAKDLDLNNTQIGALAAGLALAWALSSYFITAWSENRNRHKLTFIAAVFVFSICSFGSGMAISFATLLIARVVMGIAEGPVVPLAQIFVERESTPSRLGLNVGILQAIGSALFGSILAPVILVAIAENIGWQKAFFVAGIPGLLLGCIAWFYIKPSTAISQSTKEESSIGITALFKYHNIRWGIATACCFFGWWFATLPFISKYFVDNQGMSNDQMGATMGILGIAGLVASIIIPTLSDKIGRKKALIIAGVLGVFFPFAVYYLNGTSLQLPAMFISYALMGSLPIIAAVIPSEAVPAKLKAKALGLTTAIAEIVGGVMVPGIAGVLSDTIDDSAFLWVSAVLAILGIFCVLKLKKPFAEVPEDER